MTGVNRMLASTVHLALPILSCQQSFGWSSQMWRLSGVMSSGVLIVIES